MIDPEIGIHHGVKDTDYHKWKGASCSRLTAFERSAFHCWYQMNEERDVTPAMRFGQAMHKSILEPKLFEKEYRLFDGDRRSKDGKALWEALCAEVGEDRVLKGAEFEQVISISKAVCCLPKARKLMYELPGRNEVSLAWHDKATGVLCKGRADRIVEQESPSGEKFSVVIDVKTTLDASTDAFTRSVFKFNYFMQAAHYLEGLLTLGQPASHFVLVAVEKDPPFGVALYRITEDALAAGRKKLAELIPLYGEAESNNDWPGYPDFIQDIAIPRWAFNQIDQEA